MRYQVGRESGSCPAQLDCPNTDTDHSNQTVPVLFAPLFLEGQSPTSKRHCGVTSRSAGRTKTLTVTGISSHVRVPVQMARYVANTTRHTGGLTNG
jgi:hypothetical protein